MAKTTRYNEAFPQLEQQTRAAGAEAAKYAETLKTVTGQLENMLKVTAQGIKLNGGSTLSEIEALQKAYQQTGVMTEELAKAKLLLAKAETEATKQLILENKERDRQAKISQKAAQAAQKEIGAYKQMSKQLTDLRNKYKDLAAAGQANTAAGKGLLKQVTDLDGKLKQIDATVGQHQRNVGNYRSALEGLPGPIGNAVSSVGQLSKAFMALLANPVGAVIAAIVVSLYALFNAFTKTDSGGTQFAAVMEQISAITEVCMQRLAGFARGLMALGRGDWAAAMFEFDESLKGIGKQLEDATAAAKAYTFAIDELEDAEISYISEHAKRSKEISELEFFASDKRNSAQARRDALTLAIQLGEEEVKKMAEFAKRRYEIELDYAAALYQIDVNTLKQFIEADDAIADEMLKSNAQLAKARDDMNDEGQKKLEEAHAKVISEEQKFFEENKRNVGKLSAFDEEQKKEKEAADKLAAEEKEKLNKEKIAREKWLNDKLSELYQQNLDAVKAAKKKEQDILDKAEAKRLEKEDQKWAAYQKRVKENADAAEKAAEERAERIMMIEEMIADDLERRTNQKLAALDKEVEASKEQQEILMALAVAGNKDAEASITVERKRQAELEAERAKQAEKARKQQLYIAAVQGYTAKVQAGDKNAVFSELKDLGILLAGIQLLPSFYEGTEDTGAGGGLDGKGGFGAILHPRERVVDAANNRKFHGLPNDVAADVVDMATKNILLNPFDRVSVAPGGELQGMGLNVLAEKLDAIERNTANNQKFEYIPVEKALIETITTKGKVQRNHYKAGGLW